MVSEVENVIELLTDMSSNDRCNFRAKVYGNHTRVFASSLRGKMIIHEHLKHSLVQRYTVLDREIPLQVVIRELPRSTDLDFFKEKLACKGFCAIKVSQLKSRRYGKPHPLFSAELPKKETSFEIFKLKTIFSIRIGKIQNCKKNNTMSSM